MKKSIRFILMLCLFVSGALSYANGVVGMKNKINEGTPIELVKKTSNDDPVRDILVSSEIEGLLLTVSFAANMGQATVEVTTLTGAVVEHVITLTPTDVLIYIPFTGNYVVTITLSNGDIYYGNFNVTD